MNNTSKAIIGLTIAVLFIGLSTVSAWFYIKNKEVGIKENQSKRSDSSSAPNPANNVKANANNGLQNCLDEAENSYWSFVKLNAESSRETDEGIVYTAQQNVWDTATTNKQKDEDSCYRKKETGAFDSYNSNSNLQVTP